MALSFRRRQIVAATGTPGSFAAGSVIAANAKVRPIDPRANIEVEPIERAVLREQLGRVTTIAGRRLTRIRFSAELKGSSAAGTAPALGTFIKACGFSETVQSGSAAIGSVVSDPTNSTVASQPVVAGTNVNTVNGRLVVTIETIVTDTSIAMRLEFFADDGSAVYETEDLTQSAAGAVTAVGTELAGVTIDFGDPSSTTTGFQEGDRYYINLTSSSSAQVIYKPINTGIDILDLTLLQDGREFNCHDAAGNFDIAFATDAVPIINFEFMGVVEDNTNGITDQAILTGIAYEDVAPPAWLTATISYLGGTPGCINSFTLAMNNEVIGDQCATQATGYEAFRIVGRNPQATLDPYAQTAADYTTAQNPWTKMLAGGAGVLQVQSGTTAGNIVVVDANRAQVREVTDEERNQVGVDALGLNLAEPEFDAGGDYEELTLTFK